jgi:putative peptidoglycan lipid II flippase
LALKACMTAITAFGLALSLCAQMLAAYLFGAGSAMDAYFAGVALPMFIVLLANEVSALYVVPKLHRTLREQGAAALVLLQARLLAASVVLWALVAVLFISASASIVAVLFPGFGAGPAREAAHVLALWSVAIPFSTTAALLLQFRCLERSYALPYFLFLLTPLFVIGTALALHREAGPASLALGSAIGAATQFCALFCLAKAWTLPFRKAFRRRIGITSWHVAAAVACAVIPVHAVSLMDRHFASALGAGALSAVSYSWFFAMAAVSLVFRGWSMPVFHGIASDAADEAARFRRRMLQSTRELLLIALAMVVALEIAGPAVITLLLQRGAFAPDDARLVEAVFRYHSVSVLGLALFMLFVRACAAAGNHIAAAALGAIACASYAALAGAFLSSGALGLAQASAATWSVIGLGALAYMTRAGWLGRHRAYA